MQQHRARASNIMPPFNTHRVWMTTIVVRFADAGNKCVCVKLFIRYSSVNSNRVCVLSRFQIVGFGNRCKNVFFISIYTFCSVAKNNPILFHSVLSIFLSKYCLVKNIYMNSYSGERPFLYIAADKRPIDTQFDLLSKVGVYVWLGEEMAYAICRQYCLME